MNREIAEQARQRISPYIERTPLIQSRFLSERVGREVYLKLETQQPTGAFKVRAAFNAILVQLQEAKRRGVVASSSGNYAQAVSYAAHRLGVKAAIIMTEDSSPFKIERTRAWGAEVILCAPDFESRFTTVEKIRQERGSLVLHPFDSEETIAGNSTVALELLEQLPNQAFTLFCPASGGGLISGIAQVLKSERSDIQIVGVQPEKNSAILKSLQAGSRLNVGKVHTVADALVASTPGERTFDIIRNQVDRFTSVTEDEILQAVLVLFLEQKLVVEPGGAVSVAALIKESTQVSTRSCICILSGGNIEPSRIQKIMEVNTG